MWNKRSFMYGCKVKTGDEECDNKIKDIKKVRINQIYYQHEQM